MGRSNTRLRLELIKNEKSRNVTFRKRKKGLFKKAYELNRLCDVKSCVIIYENKPNGQPVRPETYPDNPIEVKQIIDKFMSVHSSKVRRDANTLAEFYNKKIMELKKETVELRKENDKAWLSSWDERLNNFSLDQVHALIQKLEHQMEDVQKHHDTVMMRSKQYAIHEGLLPQMTSFPNNDVEYSHMLALNQCRTSGLMMYKNDGDSPEEQYNLQLLFQSNPIDYQAHQNYYNGSITMNGNGMSCHDYNIQNAPSTSNVSNYAKATSSMKLGSCPQYGSMDENVAFYHVPPQNVYPMSASYLFDQYQPSSASQRLVKTNASSSQT